MDIDWSQKLTLSTLRSCELKPKKKKKKKKKKNENTKVQLSLRQN